MATARSSTMSLAFAANVTLLFTMVLKTENAFLSTLSAKPTLKLTYVSPATKVTKSKESLASLTTASTLQESAMSTAKSQITVFVHNAIKGSTST